ncbi:MAG: hypothetical protein OXH50_02240 [Gemmatimonadetes bacterium]|nr:hypothetical protein [Gemmatimonadota bacterium]
MTMQRGVLSILVLLWASLEAQPTTSDYTRPDSDGALVPGTSSYRMDAFKRLFSTEEQVKGKREAQLDPEVHLQIQLSKNGRFE